MNIKTDILFSSNSRPRAKTKQIGSSSPYTSYTRPLLERLEIYENTFKYEPVIQQSINLILDALIGALGELEHPDPDIQEFCRYNLRRQEDLYCSSLLTKLREVIKVTLWAGFSVTEPIFEHHNDQLLLKDYATYHPTSITIRTNTKGQLLDGDNSYEGPYFKSGVYQTVNNDSELGEVRLPLWKIALLTHNKEFNNYYGQSIVESSYRWHVLKEAITDMMLTTLDRYGNPMTLVYVPKLMSGESEINPVTGESRPLSLQEVLERQITEEYKPSDSNFLFIPFTDGSLKPSAQILSGSNNLGSSFLDAISYCQKEIMRNLLIPYSLLDNEVTSGDVFSERQIEIFNRIINSVYQTIVIPFINQTLHQLVLFNFNRESAQIPPRLPLRKTTRPEARVALMQMIRGLTETGYLNPTQEADWSAVREMVDALDRKMDKKDLQFIKDIFINPKQRPTSGATNKSDNPEGSVRGANTPGRPTGKPSPNDNSRLLIK